MFRSLSDLIGANLRDCSRPRCKPESWYKEYRSDRRIGDFVARPIGAEDVKRLVNAVVVGHMPACVFDATG